MASLTFYLRLSRRGGSFPCRLCLRIVHRRVHKSLSSPYRLSPDEFMLVLQGGCGLPSHLEDVRLYMDDVRKTFVRITGSMNGPACDAESIIRHFRYDSSNLSDYGLFLSQVLESSGQVRTARAYRSAVKRLSGFTGRKAVPFTAISPSLVESFER